MILEITEAQIKAHFYLIRMPEILKTALPHPIESPFPPSALSSLDPHGTK